MPAVMRLGLLAVLACLCLVSCGGSDDEPAAGGRVAGCSKGAAKGPFSELPYRVESTPGAPGSFAQTVTALCRRLARVRLPAFHIRQAGHELVVATPRQLEADVISLARPGRIAFLDWHANVLGPRGPDSPFAGRTGPFEAVEVASRMAPRAEPTDVAPTAPLPPEDADRWNNAFGQQFYLFGRDRRLLAGPAAAPGSLATASARAPAGARILRVPEGVAVVAAPRFRGKTGRWFVIEDDSELSQGEIAKPRADADSQTRAPTVTFDFNEQGRAAFSALTGRIVQRATAAGAGGGPAAARVAIVLDGRVVSLATIDPRENPNGLDGRTGAQINDVGSRAQARRLALLLREDPLPAHLVPLFGER